MFGEHFYHKKIRNTVIAFGTIFNNVNIKRLDSSGNPLQNIKIPLSYSPKEKFLARLDAQQDLTGDDSKVAITLPRMSFEVTGYSYDGTRKLNKNQKITKVTTKTGDAGQTSLGSGERVKKDHPRVNLLGDLDHLNSVIGWTITSFSDNHIIEELKKIQQDIFNISPYFHFRYSLQKKG